MAFYLVDKQKGVTSNKTLSTIKNQLNIRKAGFSGVLDPFATGLLIIGTEGDTRFLELMLNSRKTYTGVILFGKATDTFDTEGEVIDELDGFELNIEQLRDTISKKFIGEIEQVPPKYSNIKVNGQRAHKLIREGKEFELKSVKRTVHSFTIDEISKDTYKFETEVSSGTYIRSLAYDLGQAFGIPSMLIELRRTKIGSIELSGDITEVNREDIVEMVFKDLDSKSLELLLHGKSIALDFIQEELIVQDEETVL